MWTPDWLYERLPFCYLAAGVACLGWLGTTSTVVVSALLLFTAALLTLRRRRHARSSTDTDGDADGDMDTREERGSTRGRAGR